MIQSIDANRRDKLCRSLMDDFNLDPAAAADVVRRLEVWIEVWAAPGYRIHNDATIPRDAKVSFNRFRKDLGRLAGHWRSMGDRAQYALTSAARTFALEQKAGLSGYPDAVSREDYADPEFFDAMGHALDRHNALAPVLDLLQEIVAAADSDMRNLQTNEAARTDARIAFLAHVLHALPLAGRPPKYVNSPVGFFCQIALEAFDTSAGDAQVRAGAHFPAVFFAAIDRAYR